MVTGEKLDDLALLARFEKYDETPDEGEFFGINLMPDVSDVEVNAAQQISSYTRGIMLVTGMPRQGKGLYATTLAWKLRRYFGKRVIMDYRPRKLFDDTRGNREPYQFFNEAVFVNELEKMGKMATGEMPKEISVRNKELLQKITNISNMWMDEKGEGMFKDAVLVLDEGWRYFLKRRPHNPMGILLAGLIKLWGHLDLLIVIVAPKMDELDDFTCIPYLNYHVACSWMLTRPDTVLARIYTRRVIGKKGVHMVRGKPKKFEIDGAKPRDVLGGKRYYDLYRSKSAVKVISSKIPKLGKSEW